MIPKEIVLRLHERYDEEDIIVLHDWCLDIGADEWARLLRDDAYRGAGLYKAIAVMAITSAFMPVIVGGNGKFESSIGNDLRYLGSKLWGKWEDQRKAKP